jgi:hypothetical protein
VERIVYFFVVPEATWLLIGTVVFRTLLMLALVLEYLAVMQLLPRPRWQAIRRRAIGPAVLLVLALVCVGAVAFAHDYGRQRLAASPLRPVVERIQSAGRPSDGVVVTSRDALEAIASFLPGQEVRVYTRDDGEFALAAFEAQWASLLGRHAGMWLVLDYAHGQSADWNAALEGRLSKQGYQTVDEWVGPEQRLVHYLVAGADSFRMEDVNAVFGGQVRLAQAALDDTPLAAAGVLRLQIYWEPLHELSTSYQVFIHLVAADGRIAAQRDLPLPADTAVSRIGLLLPSSLAAGSYQLRVGVYDAGTGARLVLPDGQDAVAFHGIEIH